MATETVVPEGTNIILNDTVIPDSQVRSFFADLKPSSKVSWLIFNSIELTGQLEGSLSQIASGLIFLFPGESSQPIRQQLNIPGYTVPTSRSYLGNRSTGVTAQIPPELTASAQDAYCSLAIIDDVIATGETIATIKKSVEYQIQEQGFAPRIIWAVFALLKQKSASVSGFRRVECIVEYSRRSGRVPLNSLSTLLSNTPKGESVKNLYAQKYFIKPADFLGSLNQLSADSQKSL